MKCLVCGRALKDAMSIQRGYGPVCYRKINPAGSQRTSGTSAAGYSVITDDDYSVPGQMELSEFIDMMEGGNADA